MAGETTAASIDDAGLRAEVVETLGATAVMDLGVTAVVVGVAVAAAVPDTGVTVQLMLAVPSVILWDASEGRVKSPEVEVLA
jgi:hypothetical protein